MHERRAVLDKEADEPPNRLRRDDVVVVEDQHERLVGGRHGIDKDGPDEVRGCVRSRADQAKRRRLCLRSDRPKRGGEVADEPDEVVVSRIERQPGERHATCCEPARERDRLAVSGRCRQEGQAGRVIERPVEERALDPNALAVTGAPGAGITSFVRTSGTVAPMTPRGRPAPPSSCGHLQGSSSVCLG